MTTVQETSNNIKFKIPKRDDINLTGVYNRPFFMAFNFQDFHVEKEGEAEPLVINQRRIVDDTTSIKSSKKSIPIIDDETGAQLVNTVFGKEMVPNGYSDLPLNNIPTLKKDELVQEDDISDTENIDEDESDEELSSDEDESDKKQKGGAGLLENIQLYANKYIISPLQTTFANIGNDTAAATKSIENTSNKSLINPDIANKDIVIAFPRKDQNMTIRSLAEVKSIKNDLPPSIMSFTGTGINYNLLENILKDLLFQMDYFKQMDVTVSQIRKEFIYEIQGRYVLLDGESITILNKTNKNLRTPVFDFVFDFLGKKDKDINVSLAEINGTGIYYLLKRLDTDGAFEWI